MQFEEFLSKYLSELEKDQPRHNLMISIMNRSRENPSSIRYWSLGDGAACAIQVPPNYIVLGNLNVEQCDVLAKTIRNLDFVGCIGPSETSELLANRLTGLGITHELTMPQRIHVLEQPPNYPVSEGRGRKANSNDIGLFCDWFDLFFREALPHETPFGKERMKQMFTEQPVFFWENDGYPVSMAMINRETINGVNISFVFTPQELRGRGFAGSATAYTCENAFKEGKKFCFLYTDLRNPISNRVYQKIGFRSWCDSKTYTRIR